MLFTAAELQLIREVILKEIAADQRMESHIGGTQADKERRLALGALRDKLEAMRGQQGE